MYLLLILLSSLSRRSLFVTGYTNATIHTTTRSRSTHRTSRQLQQANESLCEIPIQLDPEKGYKSVYVVGVLAIRGFDDAFAEFNASFNTYLSATAGLRFDPPIQFEMKPLNFSEIFSDVESETVDFIYFNPSAYSCIESEYEAQSLVSQVSRRKVGGQVFDLKKFGGVIATTRDDIQTVTDLKDKVIAAASISGLGSGQMQFQLMIEAGMNYLQDPKQLIFTSDQGLVVEGLLNGDFDVGFVRTDQLERTTDADGNPVDISHVRIIDPKPGLAIDGVPFPFLSSTDLFAEWNVAALTHVDPLITEEVQRALLGIQDYSDVGKVLSDCIASNGTEVCLSTTSLGTLYKGPVKCTATSDVVLAAFNATSTGKYARWTTSLSYLQLRSMQEATGFISEEPETNIWRCIRSEELYQAITCPAGYNLKSEARVDSGCEELGLTCQEGYQCICQPCEKPYELVCVNSVMVGDKCVSLAVFLPSIIIPILVLVAVVVHLYVEHRRRQSDSLWIVNPTELCFETPPMVIGQGTFGLVLLAEYRGTQVAVKRVIPPSSDHGGQARLFDVMTSSHASGTLDDDDADSDPEVGLLSMNPGMKSMFPGKLVRKLREDEILNTQNASRSKKGIMHSFRVCFGCEGKARDTALQTQLKAAFVSEIRQLARLRHPCITTVMGAIMPTRKDEPMLVMEYMMHGSLYDVLQDDSIVLKPEQMLAILQDVASGLRFLHSATPQVVHGDLKAQNVLIDANFCAKVTDFGLSGKKQLGAVGTPYWMSPELLSGDGVNTAASDIYAYGMVMYELYSGRAPYAGEQYAEVVQQICSPTIRKRPQIPLHCPPKIAKLMSDCFEHDPLQRPTAEQLDLALKVELKVKERTSRLEALNRELEKANQKIASASALQLQHFACMSHEIRTPLNCIIGLSSLLEETELNPMQRESMEMIISSGKLLRQIVDDVLDYSKLESGNAQVLIQRINLQETLNAVIHLIQTTQVTTEKNLKVITNYDPLLPEIIHSDSRRIQQILYNLLGNAIKFSPEDGLVEFSVKILASVNTIQFKVKDYGKGIGLEDFEKIFEPFRQTETGLSNTAGGTGLGLAITKKLVHAMEGNIAVDSVLGSWTEFTVDFPIKDRDNRVTAESLSKRLNSSMVLFVSDHLDPDAPRIEAIFGYFNIEYTRFHEMKSLNEALALGTGPFAQYRDAYVCLAHEDLCDVETFEIMASKVSSCLVTFGPKFSIERVTKKHWRSLVETFPSVLIDRLGRLVEDLLTSHDRKGRSQNGADERNSAWADLRILVAEDNVVNQKVMIRILNRLGITSIEVARNGLEAVEMEAKKAYDLVLMDMQMPKMDGIAACQEINKRKPKAENGHALAKVIFVTAHVSDTFRQTCLENGAIGYLPKPCTVEGMKEVLKHLVGSGSLFSPAYQESWNKNTVPPFQEA